MKKPNTIYSSFHWDRSAVRARLQGLVYKNQLRPIQETLITRANTKLTPCLAYEARELYWEQGKWYKSDLIAAACTELIQGNNFTQIKLKCSKK